MAFLGALCELFEKHIYTQSTAALAEHEEDAEKGKAV